jgi:RNA polymerase sigma factor (sigma-70 family)
VTESWLGPSEASAPARTATTVPDHEVLSGPDDQGAPATNGDQQWRSGAAFDAFYDREMPRLVALAQEAMIVAYRRWNEVARYDHPEAWVRRVCANAAVSLLRRRSAESRALLRLGNRRQVVPLEEPAEDFWAEVRRLPHRQAQAVALRYVYDLEVEDIARTMGCAEGSVKVHLSRARTTLGARLAAGEGGLA